MVLPPLFFALVIDLLIVSGGTVFFGGFRDSMVFVFLVVLHSLVNLSVLLRGVIFKVTLRTNVSRFVPTVSENIISGFL